MSAASEWTTVQCRIPRSIAVALLVQFSSCRWKWNSAVVVLQNRVLTKNFQPVFSLVVRRRLFCRACAECFLGHFPHQGAWSKAIEPTVSHCRKTEQDITQCEQHYPKHCYLFAENTILYIWDSDVIELLTKKKHLRADYLFIKNVFYLTLIAFFA